MKTCKESGCQYAENEAEYRKALRIAILNERQKGTPVTIIGDVCRGQEHSGGQAPPRLLRGHLQGLAGGHQRNQAAYPHGRRADHPHLEQRGRNPRRVSMSINRVCISGNLTRDPVLRSTSGGMSVLSWAWPSTTAARTSRPGSGRTTRTSSTARCSAPRREAGAVPRQRQQGGHRGQAALPQLERPADRPEAQRAGGRGGRAGVHERPATSAGLAPQQYAPQAAPQAPQARTYGQGRPAPAPAPQQPAYAPQPATQQAYAPQQPAPQQQAMPDLYDEDIPF